MLCIGRLFFSLSLSSSALPPAAKSHLAAWFSVRSGIPPLPSPRPTGGSPDGSPLDERTEGMKNERTRTKAERSPRVEKKEKKDGREKETKRRVKGKGKIRAASSKLIYIVSCWISGSGTIVTSNETRVSR